MAIEYDSAARRAPLIEEFVELLRYRDLLRLLILKNIKTRYKRSVLGVAWTLLNPLLNTAVLAFAFSSLFHSSLPNYPVYILCGLIGWNFFSQSTTQAMFTLVWGGGLLKRVYVPRTILAVAAIGTGVVNLVLTLIPLALVMLVLRQPFHPTWWFLPIAAALLAMFTLGVALGLSAVAVLFTDVLDVYQVALQAWFFLTPVIYPRSILPPEYAWLLNLNPLYYLLELFRLPIYAGVLPDQPTFLVAVLVAVLTLLLGWWLFALKADELAHHL